MLRQALRFLFSALTVALFAAPADAAVWHSGFDPTGSVTFSGNALFQIDDSCFGGSGTPSAASCNTQLLSATVSMTGAGGSSAQLGFTPQAILGQPGVTVVPGDIFTAQLTELTGGEPGAIFTVDLTIGAPAGGGLFDVSSFTVIASTVVCGGGCAPLTQDANNLHFDSTDFELSGDLTGTFLGSGGGLHTFDLGFTDPTATWTFTDTRVADGRIRITTGAYATVTSLDIVGAALTGMNSGLIGPALVTDDSSPLFGPWWLEWQTTSTGNEVLLFTGSCNADGCSPDTADGPVGTALNVTFDRVTTVPEPNAIALLLGGLGAAWIARRRKRTV
jgi:hypothetical protein